jgi:hypothetical protein
MTTAREDVLTEAINVITNDRNAQYGPPSQDFQRIAAAMNAYGFRVSNCIIEPHHIAMIMIMLKLSRIMWSPQKEDHWVDIAGYTGCGWETVTERPQPR